MSSKEVKFDCGGRYIEQRVIVLCKVTLRAMTCKLVFNGMLLWIISCLMRMDVPPDGLFPSGP